VKVNPEPDALRDALRQIALIDQDLRAVGDLVTLARFGQAEEGFAIAASLGHVLLSSAEARTVDRLAQMPDGATLVRTYLKRSRVPRMSVQMRFGASGSAFVGGSGR
jgi:hypothetical protein